MSRFEIHQKDANEDDLREFLECHGAFFVKTQRPIDGFLHYRGNVAAIEFKMPGKNLEPAQDAFFRAWPGFWAILMSEVDCRWLLSVMTPQKPVELDYQPAYHVQVFGVTDVPKYRHQI